MRDAYLSIDLDYFNNPTNTSEVVPFFKNVFQIKRPILIVSTHHLMLHDINQYDHYKLLYNVDYHSDLCELNPGGIGEGTWVNYVKWRKQATFIWHYPHPICKGGAGLCHEDHDWPSRNNPFTHKDQCEWKVRRVRHGLQKIEWDRIDRINICLSPSWTCRTMSAPIIKLLEAKGLLKNLSRKGRIFVNDIIGGAKTRSYIWTMWFSDMPDPFEVYDFNNL